MSFYKVNLIAFSYDLFKIIVKLGKLIWAN